MLKCFNVPQDIYKYLVVTRGVMQDAVLTQFPNFETSNEGGTIK